MGGETTQRDIVFDAEFQNLEGLIGPKAVANQHSWFLFSLSIGLGIKQMCEPLQTDS